MGEKLKTEYYTIKSAVHIPMGSIMPYTQLKALSYETTRAYCGSLIYENDVPSTWQIDNGYVSLDDSKYHFYFTDHEGNTRAVVNQDGTVEQVNNYYPYGLSYAKDTKTTANRFKYNDKELETMHSLDWYDYGARFYDPELCQWHSVDPLAEKYYDVSPYAYCADSPVLFIDPNGQEIWIHYNDSEGNQQRIQYMQGTDYKGNNPFVQNTFSYLNAINGNGGFDMLSILSSSKNAFDFVNQPATDKRGKAIDGALNFDGNQSGGGTIYAGALMGNTSEYSKIESTSHELFHGLQQEQGQGGASVYNEVEANVYSSNITINWSNKTSYFGGMSGNGLGNSTSAGVLYQQSFNNLTNGFSNSDFVNAVKSFQGGSEKNATGLYNSYPLQRSNQTRSILQQFYPKRIWKNTF